jgi:hypothetical protein
MKLIHYINRNIELWDGKSTLIDLPEYQLLIMRKVLSYKLCI